MFTAHGVGEKEADSFIAAHRKKHNKFSMHTHTHARMHARIPHAHVPSHTYTHTHTHAHRWEAELQATTKEVRLERRTNEYCLSP